MVDGSRHHHPAPQYRIAQACRLPTQSHLNQPQPLHLTDGQHGAHGVDVLVCGEHFDHEVLEARQVFRDAMQQEVAIARDHPCLAHQRPLCRGSGERLQVGFRLVLEADHAEGNQIEAELRAVQHRVIAFDDAGFLELAHATQARRSRDSDPVGELDVGHSAVCLQLTQDLYVDGIEFSANHACAFL